MLNNPLRFTDPGGFSWWTQWRRPILAIAAAVLVPYFAGQLIFAQAAAGAQWALNMVTIVNSGGVGVVGLTSTGNFIAATAGGFAAGGISRGNN